MSAESCVLCGLPAVVKIGEELPPTMPPTHNLTAYVCREHGDRLFHGYRDSRGGAWILNVLAAECHFANRKWWVSVEDGVTPLKRNKGELLMLIVSEIAEAMEGERKDLMDDKLPHRKMAEVELADALIRILDYAAAFKYDLSGAFREKMAYNATRVDHTHEARKIAGGKQF